MEPMTTPATWLASVPIGLALVAALGCTQAGPGRGAYYVEVPDVSLRPTEGAATIPSAPVYRGFCEEHGELTSSSTDRAGVDHVVEVHNTAYHRVFGSRFWEGRRITVVAGG
jgi:hypothetical protein